MRPLLPLTLLLAVPLVGPAHAKKPDAPSVPTVPAIEEVVAAEGFVPTPSQSEIYKPGAVLVPNGRGGHDVVVESCVDVEPSVSIMSQSSIATTLAGGVSARLGMARGAASAGVEKRLSFVDPEQRTISLGLLDATDACSQQVQKAARFQDLSEAIVLHDVLVAIIKNTVCTKADASGGVVALGSVEASAYSECVQESDGQVPLGFKAVPLDKVLAVSDGVAAIEIGPVMERGEAEVEVGGDVDFAELARRAAQAKAVREAKEAELATEAERIAAEQQAAAEALSAERARLEEQERVAAAALEAAQRERISEARDTLLAKAAADLAQIQPLLDMALSDETKPVLQAYVDKWGDAKVRVDALTEAVEVPGVAMVLGHLRGLAGIEWVSLGHFDISKTEVTVAQYRACVEAGACTEPKTEGSCNWGQSDRDDHPINCVDWNQATTFATWAGGRLPSEAEWTHAAKSGRKAWKYPWGNQKATCSWAIMDDGDDGCGEGHTWPVCSKPAGNSTQGVCDLAGNVSEWTAEAVGPNQRVRRGGCYLSDASYLRVSKTFDNITAHRRPNLGFRLAR